MKESLKSIVEFLTEYADLDEEIELHAICRNCSKEVSMEIEGGIGQFFVQGCICRVCYCPDHEFEEGVADGPTSIPLQERYDDEGTMQMTLQVPIEDMAKLVHKIDALSRPRCQFICESCGKHGAEKAGEVFDGKLNKVTDVYACEECLHTKGPVEILHVAGINKPRCPECERDHCGHTLPHDNA